MLHTVAVGVVIGNAGGEPDVGEALHIGVGREEQFEARRQHADDLGGARRSRGQALAQDVGAAAEAPLPVFVGEHHDGGNCRAAPGLRALRWRRLRHPVGFGEAAAQDGGGAHHPQEVGADLGAADQFGGAVLARHDITEGHDRGHIREDRRGAVAQVEEIGVREREVLDVAPCHVGKGEDQAVGILVGQRAKEYGVRDAEDRGRRADAESDRQDGGGGEHGALAQRAQSKGEVAKKHLALQEFVPEYPRQRAVTA